MPLSLCSCAKVHKHLAGGNMETLYASRFTLGGKPFIIQLALSGKNMMFMMPSMSLALSDLNSKVADSLVVADIAPLKRLYR